MKRFGLPSSERIKRANDFKEIFTRGKVVFSDDLKLKTNYITERTNKTSIKIAVAVNKKAGSAVWRNRIKRLLRAAFRLNKHEIIDSCIQKNISLKMVFSPAGLNEGKNKKIKLVDVMPGIIGMMEKIKNRL